MSGTSALPDVSGSTISLSAAAAYKRVGSDGLYVGCPCRNNQSRRMIVSSLHRSGRATVLLDALRATTCIARMSEAGFRRVIYWSMARAGAGYSDLSAILAQSRINNGLDGLSDLSWTDGDKYVQLLEDSPEGVALTLARIVADPRHGDIRFISIRLISDAMADDRAFGDWSMASLPGDRIASTDERMTAMLGGAPVKVRDASVGLIKAA